MEYYQDEGQQFNEQQVQEQIQSLFDQPQQQDLSHEEEEVNNWLYYSKSKSS